MGLLYKIKKPPVGHMAWEGGLENTLLSMVIKLYGEGGHQLSLLLGDAVVELDFLVIRGYR